jgi:flavorubredoxin
MSEEFDCLVIGSPTMAWAPTKAISEFLEGLKGKAFSGRSAACFDTQLKSIISGNGNKAMEAKLTELGFILVLPALQSYVEGRKDAYKFKDGEVEKAAAWGRDLANKLSVKK